VKPNATIQNSGTADYLDELLEAGDITRAKAADLLGISERQMYRYLSGECPIPYLVQYGIEAMVCGDTSNGGRWK